MSLGEDMQKVGPQLANDVLIGQQHVTITLHPDMYAQRAISQYKKSIKVLAKLLEAYTDRFLVVAELTRNGNVHYHVVLTWRASNDLAREMFNDDMKSLHKMFGNILYNEHVIENEKERLRVWNYITKEIVKTKAIFNKRRAKFQVEPVISWARETERNTKYFQHVDFGCLDIIREDDAIEAMDFDKI